MKHAVTAVIAGVFGLTCAVTLPDIARSEPASRSAAHPQSAWTRTHRVVIQITENDPAVMQLALNNAENLVKFYQDKGEPLQIEFVAYGPGLNMFRSDNSPVKERVAAFASRMKNVKFSGCGNTLTKQSKQENKDITLIPDVEIVPAGIARVVELEEQGWTYVRP